jgi:hypothetical protein
MSNYLAAREGELTVCITSHNLYTCLPPIILFIHSLFSTQQMRPAFEEFTDVCNVFSDIKLRQDYLHNMLDVTYFYRTANLTPAVLAAKVLECHEMWNEKNRPDKVESVTKDTAGTKEKTLKLEGGLHQQIPKGVIWQQRYSKSTKKVVVNISIHALSPIYAFYANVRSVCVELKSTDNETHTFRLKRKDIVKTIPTERDVSMHVLFVSLSYHLSFTAII